MRINAAAAAVALALVGCCGPDIWHGDVTFTPEERLLVESGNFYVAGNIGESYFHIVWDLRHRDGKCVAELSILRRPYTTDGAQTVGGSCIYLGTLDKGHIEASAAHEFGHQHGLGHLGEGQTGLMQPVNPRLQWTADDEANR